MIFSMASKLASNMTQTIQPDPPLMNVDATESIKSILSILKPESSLEPNDKRTKSKSNTPRKVQFHIVEGEYGKRGQTEFSKTPQRKSHTKKQLPIGIFDTDSGTDDTLSQLSDIEENSAVRSAKKTNVNTTNNNNTPSLLDNSNSKKFMANSRLVRLVQRKKKRKEKEERWLAMVSPDVGLYNKPKTISRITTDNNHNSNNNNTSNNNRFKSPSHYMSRGRRAWYKAQKQINDATEKKKSNVKHTLMVQHTPVHKKVNDIVMLMRIDNCNEPNIAHVCDDGNDADNDNDDVLMNNEGSVPLELIAANNNISELFSNTDKEMKANSDDDEEETHSDEMKVDDEDNNINQVDDDEDDDLVLNKLRNKFMPKAKPDIVYDDICNADNNKNKNNPIPMQIAQKQQEKEDDEMQTMQIMRPHSPSQAINKRLSFSFSSPMTYNKNINVNVNMQCPESPDFKKSYLRSIGTQTEHIQCEIGIQTELTDGEQYKYVNNTQKNIIITSNGVKYIRIEEDKAELTQIMSLYHQYPMIGPYAFNKFQSGQEWQCGNNKCTNTGNIINSYWISTKVGNKFSLCQLCATQKQENNIPQLQSLSLNIEKTKNIINTRSRTRLKRKYNETMCNNDDNDKDNDDEEDENNNNIRKRRRMNEKRIKYQKKDLVWTEYNGTNEPVIIINCHYDENEKFYPLKYELLWLNWVDTTDENTRKGFCSVSIEPYESIKSCINDKELEQLLARESIASDGWKEIKKYRPDIYNKYFDLRDKKKIKDTLKKRRASIL